MLQRADQFIGNSGSLTEIAARRIKNGQAALDPGSKRDRRPQMQVKAVPQTHAFLRQATRRLHRRIDQSSALTALTAPGISLERYGSVMAALGRAYRAVDPALAQASALCPADLPPYEPRWPSISRDLAALDAVGDCLQSKPGHLELKAPESEAEYLGIRYVVEGAQLGGRVIHGILYETFGDRLLEIGSFWTPDPAQQGTWQAQLKCLSRLDSRDSLAAAARAARSTFRRMAADLTVVNGDAS
jgi:heme oxygenase (biliverdin-IX-beta and delta-forming)